MAYADYDYELPDDEDVEDYLDYYEEVSRSLSVNHRLNCRYILTSLIVIALTLHGNIIFKEWFIYLDKHVLAVVCGSS